MALPDKLLEKLACPKCKGKLTYRQDDEQLVCPSCKLVFRIVDDIPVLLLDEAEKLEG